MVTLYPGQRFTTGVIFGNDDDEDGRAPRRRDEHRKRLARPAKMDRR